MSLMQRRFTKINEGFVCEHCGYEVLPLKTGSCRNHCPRCLWSKHVDIFPGDRMEDCQGMMEPIGIDYRASKGYIVVHRCVRCGAVCRNKLVFDDPDQPDDFDIVLDLMKEGAPAT